MIVNDDSSTPPATPAVTLAIAADAASKNEGNTGTTALTFKVTRGGTTNVTCSVDWAVTGGTTDPADGADFSGAVLPSGTLSFASGDVTKTITVNVAGDYIVEANETFVVTLSNASTPSGTISITTATASGTIVNDDSNPSVSIAAASASKPEGNSGVTAYTFTVTRTVNAGIAFTVQWAVTGTGTNAATADDFQGNVFPSGGISFDAGVTSQTITINVGGDQTVELDESFLVTLSSPTNGAVIGTATATGTIQNDDTVVTLPGIPGISGGLAYLVVDIDNANVTLTSSKVSQIADKAQGAARPASQSDSTKRPVLDTVAGFHGVKFVGGTYLTMPSLTAVPLSGSILARLAPEAAGVQTALAQDTSETTTIPAFSANIR